MYYFLLPNPKSGLSFGLTLNLVISLPILVSSCLTPLLSPFQPLAIQHENGIYESNMNEKENQLSKIGFPKSVNPKHRQYLTYISYCLALRAASVRVFRSAPSPSRKPLSRY